MKKNKSFGIFADLWDDDDVTTSIAWGLCGYRGARSGPDKPDKKAPLRKRSRRRSR